MDSSFSKALELSGMSSTTSLVVKAMIIFLVVLTFGLAVAFKKQLDARKVLQKPTPSKSNPGEGF